MRSSATSLRHGGNRPPGASRGPEQLVPLVASGPLAVGAHPASGFLIPYAHKRERAPPLGDALARLVDLRGLEPLTPCMPCRCATSCATGPDMSLAHQNPRILGLPPRSRVVTASLAE